MADQVLIQRGTPQIVALRFFQQLLRVLACGAAGAALTLVVLQKMSGLGWDSVIHSPVPVLLIVATVLFAVAMMLGCAIDAMRERSVRNHAMHIQRLSPEEFEQERLKEMPRLAREHGRSRNLSDSDKDEATLDW